jgi:tetratricopeptide (TPR) repeat protein
MDQEMEPVEERRDGVRMRMGITLVAFALAAMPGSTSGQSTRSYINEGNGLYEEGKYSEAEISYRKALEQDAQSMKGRFNLGDALHKQKKFDQSVREFETTAAGTDERETKAGALYNLGNSFLENQKYDQAIASYIESLKLNPSDMDAKYNLSYARRKLAEQQQQQQGGGDQNQDQQQQRNKDQQEKQDQQQNQQQNQQEQNQDQANRQPREQKQMSQAEAERILDVLKNEEKEVQRKLRAKPRARARTDRDW